MEPPKNRTEGRVFGQRSGKHTFHDRRGRIVHSTARRPLTVKMENRARNKRARVARRINRAR